MSTAPDGNRTLGWLLIGALFGFVLVVILTTVLVLPIPAWLGALLPTLWAVVGGWVGPRISGKSGSGSGTRLAT
jgi:hypothetical protein